MMGTTARPMERVQPTFARQVPVARPEQASTRAACKWLSPGDQLLLKASRGVAWERLDPLL